MILFTLIHTYIIILLLYYYIIYLFYIYTYTISLFMLFQKLHFCDILKKTITANHLSQ